MKAAKLYEAALGVLPDDAAIHVQCGHMFKEAGDHTGAETHYNAALGLTPDDPDLSLQLGHFYKIVGRLDASEAAYRRALELKPDWFEPFRELTDLRRRAPMLWGAVAQGPGENPDRYVSELLPSGPDEFELRRPDGIQIRRLGARQERTRWGFVKTLRGVEAIHGFCISSNPLSELHIFLDERLLHRALVKPINPEAVQAKYVFNVWVDFSPVAQGPQRLKLSFTNGRREVHCLIEDVVVAPPFTEAEYPACDGVVEIAQSDQRSPEEQINARASAVRRARRTVLPEPCRNILVLRTDQLGDLAVSVAALCKLRALFPAVRIVGLLTPANADLGCTLGLFDEVIVIEFPEDPIERRKHLSIEQQVALRARLEPYAFDIAIDLGLNAVSRPLLLLSGARFLYGFKDRDSPWLTAGFESNTLDPYNNHEIAAHSTKLLALIERLGAFLSPPEVRQRPDLSRRILEQFRLGDDSQRFAMLHTGARLEFTRWPHYSELASRILNETNLNVVMLADDATFRATLSPALAQ